MKNPHAMTEDERRRLMAGTMDDLERRRMLNRIMSWWTPERTAEALIAKAEGLGITVLEMLRRPIEVQ